MVLFFLNLLNIKISTLLDINRMQTILKIRHSEHCTQNDVIFASLIIINYVKHGYIFIKHIKDFSKILY